jgi:hypothetical protein
LLIKYPLAASRRRGLSRNWKPATFGNRELLTPGEARRIAVNIAKLPGLLPKA